MGAGRCWDRDEWRSLLWSDGLVRRVTVSPFFAGGGLSSGGRVLTAKKGDSHRVTFFLLWTGLRAGRCWGAAPCGADAQVDTRASFAWFVR